MKRTCIIISIFLIAFSTICVSGCRLGPAECNFHGICSNDVINIPLWTGQCAGTCVSATCDKMSGEESSPESYTYRDLSRNEFVLKDLYVIQESEGVGSNGYITVMTVFDYKFDSAVYVSYKVNVYDGSNHVGSAVVVLDDGFIDYGSDWRRLEHAINIKIDSYYGGDYHLELEYFEGKVM